MPVRELMLRLAAAVIALAVTVTLIMSLAETRSHLGKTEWALWWLPYRWSFTPKFSPIWYPLLRHGAVNALLGFLLGGKLTTKWSVVGALAGAVLALGIAMLIHGDWPRLYGRAGLNTVYLVSLFYLLLGGFVGAWVVDKFAPTNRHPRNGEAARWTTISD